MDMIDPQPTLVELLVRHVLLPCALLPQIEINSIDLDPSAGATRHLGVPLQSFAGTLELLTTDETPEALIITKKLPKRVHLIPSRPQLSERAYW